MSSRKTVRQSVVIAGHSLEIKRYVGVELVDARQAASALNLHIVTLARISGGYYTEAMQPISLTANPELRGRIKWVSLVEVEQWHANLDGMEVQYFRYPSQVKGLPAVWQKPALAVKKKVLIFIKPLVKPNQQTIAA